MPPAKKSPDPKAAPQATKPSSSANSEVPLPLKAPVAEKMRTPTARLGDKVPDSNRGGKKGGQDSNRAGKPTKKDAAAKGGTGDKKKGGKLGTVDEDSSAATQPGLPAMKVTTVMSADGKKKIEFLTEELMCASARLSPCAMPCGGAPILSLTY